MNTKHFHTLGALSAAAGVAFVSAGWISPAIAAQSPTSGPGNGSPHFIADAVTVTQAGPTVSIGFKEAGLASGVVESITASAMATTTYECVNGGGKHPQAANKTTTVTAVSTSEQFTSDRNGNVTGSVTLTPPRPSEVGFACPSGQTAVLANVDYWNLGLADATAGSSMKVAGHFTYSNHLTS